MHRDFIYLDNAATSWPKPESVGEAMVDFLRTKGGNPGRGGHHLARQAARTIEAARSRIGELINAPQSMRVVLTQGCTDSINLAIHGVVRAALKCCPPDFKIHVVTSAIEHNAVLRTLHCFASDGLLDLVIVPCDHQGLMDPQAIADACNERTVLVTVSHASNVLGTIQPVGQVSRAIRERSPDVLFMVDAAQTGGHIAIDVQRDDIDLLTIAGHKGLRGPTGTGALYVSERAFPESCTNPRLFCERRGGTGSIAPGLEMPTHLPDALEAGTPNAVGFAGLLAAMDASCESIHEHEMSLTAQILEGLKTIPGVMIYGKPTIENRMPVVLFNIKGLCAREVGAILDTEHHIAARGGVHCAPELHNAIGTCTDGGVRVSPGTATTPEQIGRFLSAVRIIAESSNER